MNPNDIAPMVISVTLFVVTGAVILLFPLSRRLGSLLEAMTQQKRELPKGAEMDQVLRTLQSIDDRLTLLEERQSFAEAILASGERRQVGSGEPGG